VAKADSSVKASTEAYLASLTLTGAQKPLAATARLLSASLEAAPTYAQARIAKELRDVLGQLTDQIARDDEMAERREARRERNARINQNARMRSG
jgi:hypothetical protein